MKINDKIAIAGVVVALVGILVSVFISSNGNNGTSGEINQTTTGSNSPAVSNVTGDVTIDYSITIVGDTKKTKPLPVLDITLPRNNEDITDTTKLIKFFDDLNELNGKIIYIRFYTYVGAGFGIKDIPENRVVRAGVVFDLAPLLDGFGGDRGSYEYGYSIELDSYREQWGLSRQSTLMFPKRGNAFFDVHYMKSMRFEGLAKVKISGMQGFEWIEIIPAQPVGYLLEQYEEINAKMESLPGGKFEF